jgi:hypothetical protein
LRHAPLVATIGGVAGARAPGWIGGEAPATAIAADANRAACPGPAGTLSEQPELRSTGDLVRLAKQVTLRTRHGKSVFYHAGHRETAEAFIRSNPSYTTIDHLLAETAAGLELLHLLKGRSWSEVRDVWWELSRRLAAESSGDVHVFGSGRYTDAEAGSVSSDAAIRKNWQSRHESARAKFADDVFEKIELPVLETNPNIDTIYYNGQDIDAEG